MRELIGHGSIHAGPIETKSLRVQEACDLQSRRAGYLNTPPPNAGVCSRAQSLLCVASRAPPPPGVGADRKAKSQAAFRPKQPGYLGSLANEASS